MKILRRIYNQIKYFIQRGKRGYSDFDLIDFDAYLLELILNMIKDFKNKKDGFPSDLDEKSWDDILKEMIERFDLTEAEQKSSTDRRRKIFQTLQWEINRDMVLEVLGYDSLEEVPADREVVLLKSFDCISMNMTVEEIHALAEHPKVSRIEFNMELEGSDFE